MISKFIKNFKKTEFWTNRNLQIRVAISALVITVISKLSPELRENILAIMIGIIIVFGPIAVWAVYHGIINDDS